MDAKKTWDEIVEAYPDRWVALTDCIMEGPIVLTAVVSAVCEDKDRLDEEKKLDAQGIRFIWRRTTDLEGAYVF